MLESKVYDDSEKNYHANQVWVKSTKHCGNKVIFDIHLKVLQDLQLEYFTRQIVCHANFKIVLDNLT